MGLHRSTAKSRAGRSLFVRDRLAELLHHLSANHSRCELINVLQHHPLPERDHVLDFLGDAADILCPSFNRPLLHAGRLPLASLVRRLRGRLTQQIARAFQHHNLSAGTDHPSPSVAETKALQFLCRLPQIQALLHSDILAAYEGDPAATSHAEILLCYPGFHAVFVHRIAHELYLLGIPLLPRMLSEHAHNGSGIDIHPGAAIGHSFFIDHGTGVVIGETAVIGNNVTIYHGVTLGAKSLRKDAHGRIMRGTRRHPTIQDGVTIYANATVLGHDTVVGHDSIIGCNVVLDHSVPPHSTVKLGEQFLEIKHTRF